MVNPIAIVIIALSVAFLLALFDRVSRNVTVSVFLLALLAMTAIPGGWYVMFQAGEPIQMVETAGFVAPLSINLLMGPNEALILFLVNLTGFLGALYLLQRFRSGSVAGMILFLMMVMGVNGLVMTRDIFNVFVFLEISSIATYAILGLEQHERTLAAGLKYMIAGGLASAFLLIGIIFLYRLTGTLNIDDMIAAKSLITGTTGVIALCFVLMALLVELKSFPANGWALDVYQAVPGGIVAMIAVVNSAGVLFVLYKLLPLFADYLPYIAGVGLLTFLASNLMGLKQSDAQRLLGYSSIGQMGLIVMALALVWQFPNPDHYISLIVGGLFLNHFIAKAALFWLAGILRTSLLRDWGQGISELSMTCQHLPFADPKTTTHVSRQIARLMLLVFFGGALLALAGFPPFPGFWAKWELIQFLAKQNMLVWMGAVLLGSLLEAAYLLRWFGYVVQNVREEQGANSGVETTDVDVCQVIPVAGFAGFQFTAGLVTATVMPGISLIFLLPVFAAILLLLLDSSLSAKIKGWLTVVAMGTLTIYLLPKLSGIPAVFGVMLLLGSWAHVLAALGTTKSNDQREGFYPLLLALMTSLGVLLIAQEALQFFLVWELMTVSSYLLILRGKKAEKAALIYILFSTAGAFLLLAGLAIGIAQTNDVLMESFRILSGQHVMVYGLLMLGFLIKLGALGAHVWLPGAYAEAEDEVSSLLSSVLSKAGVFGLFLVGMTIGNVGVAGGVDAVTLLGWLGVATALWGALMAVFQEDIKLTLAYSSMGQIGYIVLAFAAMSHLGWTTALYLSMTHVLFKAMLFLAVAGVILRTGTRNMYEMGGLIKKMPFSFISVLIAIIALSGVPPLSGFGGKWLLYNTLFERGWYLQMGVAFFASGVAFLYLFRLIHAIFLGQAKPQHKQVKEAPILLLAPQYLAILAIMAISTFPNLILKPLSQAVSPFYASNLVWDGFTLKSALGYWNGFAVMCVTMVVFALPLIWLLLVMRKPQPVKQFNIVYAAERPDRPETTHVAHNFYAHYRKALGFTVEPLATHFWSGVAEWSHSLAATLRVWYTGNGQTYALHIVLFFLVMYWLMK